MDILFFIIVVVEAITEILTASKIFFKLRDYISLKSNFLGELINCGYCLSVWVSFSISWIKPINIINHFIIDYLLTVFIIHRLSNVLHELFSRWFHRTPWVFILNKVDNKIESSILESPNETDTPAN